MTFYREQYNKLIAEKFRLMGTSYNPQIMAELNLKILNLDRLATEDVGKVVIKLNK